MYVSLFFLFHQLLSDDEAFTILLQSSLFMTVSPISAKSVPFSLRSSLMLSIQVFLCLPLLLSPLTCPCNAAFGSLSPPILLTCPNHLSLLFLTFSTIVSSAPSSSLVSSFLIFSLLHQQSSFIFFPHDMYTYMQSIMLHINCS